MPKRLRWRAFLTLFIVQTATGPLAGQDAMTFDHALFDGLLGAHVDARGLVDYDAFAGNPDFRSYLEELAETRPETLPRQERLAFWINAYNAYTIELVNRRQERTSIRNINKTLGFIPGKGPWKERMAEVAGKVWTLDEIEHEIIRKDFPEPRIHFALVCAALGCPPLRNEAYTGEELDRQLDEQARIFLTREPEKNRVDTRTGTVHLSPIFDWYREDFPAGTAEFGAFLADYFPPGLARDLLESGGFRIRFTGYDWSLNGQGSS